MSYDKELEIRRQFLDEAEEYLRTLEDAVLGLSSNRIDAQKINAALRAAHSVKGGAGMMGYQTLNDLAHRLEDSFKVLKVQKQEVEVDAGLEHLLLEAVDCLQHVIHCDRQGHDLTTDWLNDKALPIFERLHDCLGDPPEEDASSVLSPEDGQDIVPLLFETEVEDCLTQLEVCLSQTDADALRAELLRLGQELGGLGEMLQLEAFAQLCGSVVQHATIATEIEPVATEALQAWRRSQALVLTQQLDALPRSISVAGVTVPELELSSTILEPDCVPSEPMVEADAFWVEPVATASEPQINLESFTASVEYTASTSNEAVSDLPDAEDADADATVRVPVKQLNVLNDLFGELTIDRNALNLYLNRLRNLSQLLSHRVQVLERSNTELRTAYDRASGKNRPLPALMPAELKLLPPSGFQAAPVGSIGTSFTAQPHTHSFDTLELDRYDELHLLSQEVMETIVQIQEVTSDIDLSLEDIEQTSRNLNKTAKQLQTKLTQIRMRPLSDIVDRFPRALREMSLQHGKSVRLEMSGANVLIDRNILEALNDPLMHLLRNAFDHGVEVPQARLEQGKPETGVISIQAFHRGNRTFITLSDDGGGIPIEKIRAKAEQMGLDPVLLAAASDEELVSLIFEPGFSTADQVTDLSGRGVGLDVVRDRLKQIRGDIKVDTHASRGTTFTISVPFTLSVVRVLIVEMNGMLLAFPNDVIREMLALQPEAVIHTAGSDMLNLGGNIIQLVVLSRWLKFRCPHYPYRLETSPSISVPTVLMVEHNNQLVALQVDACWGEQETAVHRVEGSIPLPPGFSNCTILGDGRVVPLVNVPELLHWVASAAASAAAQTESTVQQAAYLERSPLPVLPTQKANVLVVDDSVNVRRFLALTLEKAGYQVEQAKDGQEAVEKLQAGLQVNAVICDIEMPRLDGYGFLAKVKANPAFEHLPIMMLTSRTSAKHRQLALNLGAIAYFSKPYNEQTLLSNLAQHVYGNSSIPASATH